MTKIKPCPFCGGESVAKWKWQGVGIRQVISVRCQKCGGEGTERLTKRYAIAGWNRRVETT